MLKLDAVPITKNWSGWLAAEPSPRHRRQTNPEIRDAMKFIYPPSLRKPPASPAPALPPPIPPADPRHHRFALNYLNCHSLVDSYLLAGFQCKRTTAYVNSSRLIRRPDVARIIMESMRADVRTL